MAFLENIVGNNNDDGSLSDKDIAADLLKDSKFGISMLSTATSEAVTPKLRQILSTQLNESVKDHYRLSDMMIKKNWYPAFSSPTQQLNIENQGSQNFSNSIK